MSDDGATLEMLTVCIGVKSVFWDAWPPRREKKKIGSYNYINSLPKSTSTEYWNLWEKTPSQKVGTRLFLVSLNGINVKRDWGCIVNWFWVIFLKWAQNFLVFENLECANSSDLINSAN